MFLGAGPIIDLIAPPRGTIKSMIVPRAAFVPLWAALACDPGLSEFDESRALFEELRDESGGIYAYVTRRYALSEAGVWNCHFETTVMVSENVVVDRQVVVTPTTEADVCGETGAAVAPALGVDSWYARCEQEVIPTENPFPALGVRDPYSLGEDGLLQRCGWYEADYGHVLHGSTYIYIESISFR